MSNHPLISVIIPTYERVNLTLAAVDSVLLQDYENYEIIVVDDGSSKEVLRELERRLHPCVTLLSLMHSGLPAVARNAGVACSKGEWIAFLDSDDHWKPNKLSAQIATALTGNYDCISADFDLDSDVPSINASKLRVTTLRLSSMLARNLVFNSSVLVRKSSLEEVGGISSTYNVRGVEDYATWLRIMSLFKWGHIHSALGTYATLNSEAERISSKSDPFNHIYAIVDYAGWLKSRGSSLIIVRLLFRLLPFLLRR